MHYPLRQGMRQLPELVCLKCAVQAFTVPIIQATGCSAEIVGPAAEYMRIRAYSMPATLVLMMAQV